MSKKNIYVVRDYKTGEIVAEGTSGELKAQGIVPGGYRAWNWAKGENSRQEDRMYIVSVEDPKKYKSGEGQKRPVNVYTCYNAAGDVVGKGTALELWEAGVFGSENAVYYTYTTQGGRSIKRGIAKMTCRKEMRPFRKENENFSAPRSGGAAGKTQRRPPIRRIAAPNALDYDVHDLMIYNAIAKKEGRKELTYGYWAAAGKPSAP